MNKIEIELRYFIKNQKEIEKKLISLGSIKTNTTHLIDHWYVPSNINTRKKHDNWFDVKRGAGIRIREDKITGKATLEVKKLTKAKNHNTFLESEVTIESYKKGDNFLKLMGRKKFLVIDKKRTTYTLPNFEIVIDNIKGYKSGIEIEGVGFKTRSTALLEIEKLATKLGLSKKDLAEKSLTVSAMDTLAKFN